MLVCPKCKSEYTDDVKVCPNCSIELVDELQEAGGLECNYCGNPVGSDDSYCKYCGSLFDKNIRCGEHPDTEATSLCMICKKPLCDECIVDVSEKSFCRIDCNYQFVENWAVVYTTNQEWDAQLLQEYLEDKDIPCAVDSKKDPLQSLTVGLLAEFNVMVPFDYVLQAEELLEGLEEKQFVEKAEFPEVRPWVRYWARYVDIVLGSFCFGIALTIVAPSLLLLDPPVILLGWLVVFLWVFTEAFLLSAWGTTPGKWLLRITLRDSAGQKITYSRALKRSYRVWFIGLGMGMPIFTFITLLVAHRELKNEGMTSWDREGGFVVSHEKIGPSRIIATTLISIIPIALILYGMSLEGP